MQFRSSKIDLLRPNRSLRTDSIGSAIGSEHPESLREVKPDEESHALTELDWEKEPTWDDLVLTTPERVRRNDRIGIQPLAPFARPTETDRVAAM